MPASLSIAAVGQVAQPGPAARRVSSSVEDDTSTKKAFSAADAQAPALALRWSGRLRCRC
jgi:hypothetical protein